MDTSKPPLSCDGCGKPISPGESMEWRTATAKNEDGEDKVVAQRLYHAQCAPPIEQEK